MDTEDDFPPEMWPPKDGREYIKGADGQWKAVEPEPDGDDLFDVLENELFDGLGGPGEPDEEIQEGWRELSRRR